MPRLDAFKSEPPPFALVLPRQGARDAHPQRMDGFVEEAFASALRALTVAGMLCDLGDQASIANALPIMGGIKATIEVEGGALPVSPDRLGPLLPGFEALGKEHHIRFVHGRHGARR
jgi:hypothetical protein